MAMMIALHYLLGATTGRLSQDQRGANDRVRAAPPLHVEDQHRYHAIT